MSRWNAAKKLWAVSRSLHEQRGGSVWKYFRDAVHCSRRHGASAENYLVLRFYELSDRQRGEYLTSGRSKSADSALNRKATKEDIQKLARKELFDRTFSDLLRRDFLYAPDASFAEFTAFLDRHEECIIKPVSGTMGKGIEKLAKADFKSDEDFYNYVFDKDNCFGVLEEAVRQHPEVSKIYPHSINCLRIATLVVEGKPNILYAVFKTGNNGRFVDNLESGGYACHFDLDTGTVTGPGHTSDMEIAYEHPYTHTKFKGFKIPYCEEVKELVKQAALEEPNFKYCGWDVCITENGPAIIEGNDYAAYDFPQLPDEDTPKVGLISIIRQYIPDLKL